MDDDEKDDLTSIEDLGEFIHEEEASVEAKLADFNEGTPQEEAPEGLEDDPPQQADESALEEGGGEDLFGDEADAPEVPQGDAQDEEFADEEPFAEASNDDGPLEDEDEQPPAEAVSEDEAEADGQDIRVDEAASTENEEPVSGATDPQGEENSRDLYSLAIRNIEPGRDSQAVRDLLEEYGLLTNENAQLFDQGLAHGNVLVARIAEYTAVVLAHRLSRLDIDVACALSEDIHPSGGDAPDVG